MKFVFCLIAGAAMVAPLAAGPFPPAAGVPGSDAIPAADERFTLWANGITVVRGYANIASPEDGGYATYGSPEDALGPADGTENPEFAPVVSLGDGGMATVTFAKPIGDSPGPDFAVFENGFRAFNGAYFLELAHVEVSSDGVKFFRFPSISLTPVEPYDEDIHENGGQGSSVNPTDVHNLAGKHIAGYGTPFDLAELAPLYPELDVHRVTHVRVIDVVGTNNEQFATRDADGRIIADPYPTEYPTGGFDLDAVGAFRATSTSYSQWLSAQGVVDPAVTADYDSDGTPNLVQYLTGDGKRTWENNTIGFSRLAYRKGATLALETSTDLVQWTAVARSADGGPMVASDSSAVVTETGEFRVETSIQWTPDGQPQRYFRLAAELLP